MPNRHIPTKKRTRGLKSCRPFQIMERMNPGHDRRRARRFLNEIWESGLPQAVLVLAAVLAAVIVALMFPT
jgi:hypothetical protein